MKKIISLMLVIMLTVLSVVFVSCDDEKSKDTDTSEAVTTEETSGETTGEETTGKNKVPVSYPQINKDFSYDAEKAYEELRSLVNEQMRYYRMECTMVNAQESMIFIIESGHNGKYALVNMDQEETEMYIVNDVVYVKSPEVNNFVSTSDPEMVQSIEGNFSQIEAMRGICLPEMGEFDDSVTVNITNSALGGIKITISSNENPDDFYTVETDSKVYQITQNGKVIGSGVTKIKVQSRMTEDGVTTTLDGEYTKINGKIIVKAPIQ